MEYLYSLLICLMESKMNMDHLIEIIFRFDPSQTRKPQQNFTHDTAAVLSCHVQTFEAIW